MYFLFLMFPFHRSYQHGTAPPSIDEDAYCCHNAEFSNYILTILDLNWTDTPILIFTHCFHIQIIVDVSPLSLSLFHYSTLHHHYITSSLYITIVPLSFIHITIYFFIHTFFYYSSSFCIAIYFFFIIY